MSRKPNFLLVGPYDPSCGEYTFIAPPLGVWRLAGVLQNAGFPASVFDPNNCEGRPEAAFESLLVERQWDVIGFSTTGMTLRYDLALAHLARRVRPGAILLAGGMEATFRPELMFELGPFDLVVLGEGEKPLLELGDRLQQRAVFHDLRGTAGPDASGELVRRPQAALGRDELRDAIFATPYDQMPFQRYWQRLEAAYRVGELPVKAHREATLSEIRSVRINTLNYCPMACSFCSSTNFLHEAQGGTARVGRLDAEECLQMVERVVAAQPSVRTIIFQDDIFVFTSDKRLLPLCEAIVEGKAAGRLPKDLQFISTNRIDAMTPERLAAMKRAGFRVLGFGVENFSRNVLEEFNKRRIFPHIRPMLRAALEHGITPFLDLILTSPRGSVKDFACNVKEAFGWVEAGCEVGMYPYIIPFSGAAMAKDPALRPYTISERHQIAGTGISWNQPSKILPIDPVTRETILRIEGQFEDWIAALEERVAHLPSRVRSLVWIACAVPELEDQGFRMPPQSRVIDRLIEHLPGIDARRHHVLLQAFGGEVSPGIALSA